MSEFERYREARFQRKNPKSSAAIDERIPHICHAVVRGIEEDSNNPFSKTLELLEEMPLNGEYGKVLTSIASGFYVKIGRPDALKAVQKYCVDFLD